MNSVNFSKPHNVNTVNIWSPTMDQSRNKPYHHGNLASALVNAAARLVEDGGAGTVTVRAVAQQTGVTATALYRHFADKEALLVAVASRGFALLVDRFTRAAGRDRPPRHRLTELGLAYVAFAADHPHLHALMFGARVPGADGDDDLSHWAGKSFHMLVEATAACLPADSDPHQVTSTAVALWSLVHGYATLRRDGQLAGLPADLMPDPAQVISSLVPQG